MGGQADDLAFAPGSASAEQVESIHARKTAALITAAIVAGAIAGGADDAQCQRLRRFGHGVGVAFQIADDLLDAGQDDCSLVALLGPEAARERGEAWLRDALAELEPFGARAGALRGLALFALRRKE